MKYLSGKCELHASKLLTAPPFAQGVQMGGNVPIRCISMHPGHVDRISLQEYGGWKKIKPVHRACVSPTSPSMLYTFSYDLLPPGCPTFTSYELEGGLRLKYILWFVHFLPTVSTHKGRGEKGISFTGIINDDQWHQVIMWSAKKKRMFQRQRLSNQSRSDIKKKCSSLRQCRAEQQRILRMGSCCACLSHLSL